MRCHGTSSPTQRASWKTREHDSAHPLHPDFRFLGAAMARLRAPAAIFFSGFLRLLSSRRRHNDFLSVHGFLHRRRDLHKPSPGCTKDRVRIAPMASLKMGSMLAVSGTIPAHRAGHGHMPDDQLAEAARHLLQAYALLDGVRSKCVDDPAVAAQVKIAGEHVMTAINAVGDAETLLYTREQAKPE